MKSFVDGNAIDGNNEIIIYDFKTNEYSNYLNESLVKNDVRTKKEGLAQILPNGDLFLEETNFSRILYFNADGSLRWTYLNRAVNGKTYRIGWSRIIYNEEDVQITKNFLQSRGNCTD